MNPLDELIRIYEESAWLEGLPVSHNEARKAVIEDILGPISVEDY